MNRRLHRIRCCSAVLALGILAGCGGGGASTHSTTPVTPVTPVTPAYAKTLNYVNPVSTGYRLEVDPKTNGTAHIVLHLMGPAGTAIRGVAFFLSVDTTQASWSNLGGPVPNALAGTVLNMTQGTKPTSQMFKTRLGNSGADLQVGIFQKTGTATLSATDPIVSVGLDLGATVPPGTAVKLTVTKGGSAVYVDGNETSQGMNGLDYRSIDFGTLTAQ